MYLRIQNYFSTGDRFVSSWLTACFHTFQLIVGGILFPIRLAEIVAISFGCWASAKLTVMQGITDDAPLTRWQRLTMWPIKIYGRLLLWVLGFYRIKARKLQDWLQIDFFETAFLTFSFLQVIGQPAAPEVAPIVVANHVSFIEPIYLFTQLFPTSVSRKENENIGLIGPILKATHAILVDRLDPNSRQATIKAIKDRAELAATGKGFPQVLIFPEGCTTNGKALVTFKTGAFSPGLPVQPVAFKYPYKFYDPRYAGHCDVLKKLTKRTILTFLSSWFSMHSSWCADGPGLLGMLLELTSQFKNSMTVTYLPVYVRSLSIFVPYSSASLNRVYARTVSFGGGKEGSPFVCR
jgi:lysophosphatidylcholine acyltransferase/lyso-PAF acetyltransferase